MNRAWPPVCRYSASRNARSQAVRLAIHQRFHKGSSLGLGQVDLVLLPQRPELQQHRLQGMGLAFSSRRHLLRPIGAHEEHPLPGEPSPQVKEQADGGRIGPVQVVEDQEQGAMPGHGLQHTGGLVEEEGLRGGRHSMVQHLLHARYPGWAVGQCPRALQ